MPEFPSLVELSSLNGRNGFRISGEAAGDHSGHAVAPAGDVNQDGLADLIIGAPDADPNGTDSGACYVVFGQAAGAVNIELSALDGDNGFRINGVAAGDRSGFSKCGAADINGDGFIDFIVGAHNADPHGLTSGSSYVVFGKAAGFAAEIDLSSLDGASGFRLDGGMAYDFNGLAVASAGDINGDGFADLITGAFGVDSNGNGSGSAYVVFGKATGFAANLEMTSLNGVNGFQIAGEAAGDLAGLAVASAGDVNGDGIDDIFIGAPQADPNGSLSGASYVVFGKTTGIASTLHLSGLDGTNGFQISGEAAGDWSGQSVAAAGDINGDGFGDVIIGAKYADPHGVSSGASYVVFGKATGFAANIDLSMLDGTAGFRISGIHANDLSGGCVAAAGDVNGDGFDDLVIGARGDDSHGNGTGATYVVFGKASPFAANLDLQNLDGSNGFQILGPPGVVNSGFSVAAGGDVNGDGFDDVIVGAINANPRGYASGASYVVFGHRAIEAVNRAGTNIANTINGGRGDDTMVELGGDDVLIGWEGSDRMNGGGGNDRLIGRNGNDVLIGGTGRDILRGGLDADHFVFSAIDHSAFTARDVIRDFEVAGLDLIDVSAIDAIAGGVDDAFSFIGSAAFTNPGQIRAMQRGGDTLVFLNIGGDAIPEMAIKLTGPVTLDSADFIL